MQNVHEKKLTAVSIRYHFQRIFFCYSSNLFSFTKFDLMKLNETSK